jgi:chromosome segregation ATPase
LEEINKEVNMKQIKLEEIKNEVDLKTTLLMNIEKDLLETNKQNQSSLLTRQELDKELKTQANAYEKMQSQQDILKKETDTLKDEKKKLKDDVKAQREKIEKKVYKIRDV